MTSQSMKLVVAGTLCTVLGFSAKAQPLTTPFERSKGTETATYAEITSFYQRLDAQHTTVQMEEAGPTDTKHPLHVVYFSPDGRFDIADWKSQRKTILLINNGIHPGEPDGIDASMMLLRDAAAGKTKVPDNIVLAVIPVFNIGGTLNRGCCSRANQSGPAAYGFRGNAQNLDLNRDFIKMDARETQTLVSLFRRLDPDLFIDNHVSDGADYQHVMTLLSTQADKLGPVLGSYLRDTLEPALYADMKGRGYKLVPYVNRWDGSPEHGWPQFLEGPRFASGYAAMRGTLAFVPETHMLKPFKQRVEATAALMKSFIETASQRANEIRRAREGWRDAMEGVQSIPLMWMLDTTQSRLVMLAGYEAGYKNSDATTGNRLFYDRSKTFRKKVPFYDRYVPGDFVEIPKAYVLPQGWHRVAERLQTAGVEMQAIPRDTSILLTAYYIEDYKTAPRPYEGHYLHAGIKVRRLRQRLELNAGDWLIRTAQPMRRYIVETLEPTAPDGFLAWGFFDAVLQQKEYFSDYVFEETAARMLRENPELKKEFEAAKTSDTTLAKDAEQQLDWLYRHSAHYEDEHMRHPVFRVE